MSKKGTLSLNKATSATEQVGRLRLGEIGYPGLHIDSSIMGTRIREEQHWDLQFPRSLDTYKQMTYSSTIKTALVVKEVLILKALANHTIKPGTNATARSKEAAEFISWTLKNLEGQSFENVLSNAITYNRDGFSMLEKVYTQVQEGEFKGRMKIKKLSPRSQRSLDVSVPWQFSEDGREFLGINQSTNNLPNSSSLKKGRSARIPIKKEKLMMFSWDSTNLNPEGFSPLNAVYRDWKEMVLIAEYQVIGISKDSGGTPILRIPTEILNKAAADATSPEGLSVTKLQTDLANMHAGEQAYMILPSDRDDSGNLIFDMKLIGIEGGGKQFDLDAALNARKKAILDAFGAGFMHLGNEGGGSHALMDGKTTVHEAFVGRDIDFIISVFEEQLFPQLLALNGIRLPQEEMPRMAAGDISEIDIDNASKAIQRAYAVNAIPRTVETTNETLEKLDYEFRLDENMAKDEFGELFPDTMQSRSGDGMASGNSSGTGNSSTSKSDANTGNLDKSAKALEGMTLVNVNGKEILVLDEDLESFIGDS